MTLSLNVLNHLGLNLYSNVPAVLSEVVANSYDADAAKVDVVIDPTAGTVTVTDDGHGMTREEVNKRFLTVGYERRRADETRFSPKGRSVMGRKGIGKLSLFSIANEVDVYTIRNGEKSALRMTVAGIKEALDKVDGAGAYHPEELEADELIDFSTGTRIVLRDLKKGIAQAADALRTRLARRFSVLEDPDDFELLIGGTPVTIDDRNYYHKLQYVWIFDEDARADSLRVRAKNAEEVSVATPVQIFVADGVEPDASDPNPDEALVSGDSKASVGDSGIEAREDDPAEETEDIAEDIDDPLAPASPPEKKGFIVRGWIGTARSVADLKDADTRDNLNKVSLLLRGKVAHEDLLEDFNENGVYASYLIGELHADYLDEDGLDDIATSSRQRIIEDDPRYVALTEWLRSEITKIGKQWLEYRNTAGRNAALDNPLIAEWFKSLKKDTRKRAVRLFGKINQLTIDDPKEKAELFSQAVLGFETLRYRDNLDALDDVEAGDIKTFVSIFSDISDIEATMYHQIVRQRLDVIEKLRENVSGDVLEKVLQEQLYENLWLLDPGWERATDRSMEAQVGKLFKAISKKLSKEERESRMDIQYRRTGGMNVIVELKRDSVTTNTNKLIEQVDKYRAALREHLRSTGSSDAVETVCVVGNPLKDWKDSDMKNESMRMLATKNIRVVQYQQLLADAEASYRDYLDGRHDLGRIQTLVMELAAQVDE